MKTHLLLLALVLPLAACGNDEAAPAATDDTATTTTAPDPMATTPAAEPMASDVTVDGTNAAIGSDLTAMSLTDANANIDGWIATLEGDRFTDIRASLERLKLDLAAQPLNGSAIGATLTTLGEQTTTAAETASSSSQAGLRTLGSSLSAAGARLSGGAAM